MFREMSLLFAAAGALLIPTVAGASFQIVSHSIENNAIARQTTFHLTFNQPPDFDTADQFGRPKNAFQYWVDSQQGDFDFSGADVVVIRGPEIRFGQGIPIRDTLNPTNENFPHAEGWGALRGAVPFELDAEAISFTVPWETLGIRDGEFSFDAISLEFGTQISEVSGKEIGLPSPLASCAGLLAVAWLLRGHIASHLKLSGSRRALHIPPTSRAGEHVL